MSANADSLVRDAIAAYRAGNKEQARNLLMQAVEMDEQHEQGWLWLSAVVDSVEDQITCLENVLTVNPSNQKALQGLLMLNEKMNNKPAAPPPVSAPAPSLSDDDPFANISFAQAFEPDSAPPAAPLQPDTDDNLEDELPAETAWAAPIETSSASAMPPAAEPTPDVYNEWIAGLNIGSNDATEAFGPVEKEDAMFGASPFIGEDVFLEDQAFELDRNIFGIEEDDLEADDMSAGPFTASPFSADMLAADEKPAPPASAAITPKPVPVPMTSPRSPAPKSDDDLLSDIEADDLFDDDDFLDDSYGAVDLGTVDPEEYFKYIPSDIRATRLPGTKERYPALVTVFLLLLVLLNVGAVALVYVTLIQT